MLHEVVQGVLFLAVLLSTYTLGWLAGHDNAKRAYGGMDARLDELERQLRNKFLN